MISQLNREFPLAGGFDFRLPSASLGDGNKKPNGQAILSSVRFAFETRIRAYLLVNIATRDVSIWFLIDSTYARSASHIRDIGTEQVFPLVFRKRTKPS
ncbi:hypothetical protein Q31b_04090 [Novipirellula aureliae]|uniref:Uncharacterized protein n=1 Tax=Novipirellula aureliae TaxID=2527966 RepID=A0A5C6E8U0_9BACT|nr:hypothetical protein Q31b_04090 [Novipirellula aureliae]